MEINGKIYPFLGQIVEKKNVFIGGLLEDRVNEIDTQPMQTKIKDILLESNGSDSAIFSIIGENFSCSFDVEHGGITYGEIGYVTFEGYGGRTFRIKRNE